MAKKKTLISLIATALVLVAGITALVAYWALQNGANPRLNDAEIVQDLAIIEKAAWNYKSDAHPLLLPEHMSDIRAQGLRGNLSDYTYHLVQQYEGGPNQAFALCASFHSRSTKLDDPQFQYYFYYTSPEAFTYHTQGKQCFNVGWNINGGSSSITVLESLPDWAK